MIIGLSLLFGPVQAVRIATALSPAEARARLRAKVVSWGGVGLRGRVSDEYISLFVVTIPGRNSWRPMFEGKIAVAESGALLLGSIRMNDLARLLTTLVVAGSLIFTMREVVGAFRGWYPWVSWQHHFRGLVAIPLVVAATYVGRIFSAGDARELLAELESALTAVPPDNSPPS